MAKSRTTIRSELRNDLRIDPNSKVWSDATLNQLIHEGEIEVARRNLTITELETTLNTTAAVGTRAYDLPSDLLRIISVIYDVERITRYQATTIAFNNVNPDTITDSANGLATFIVGQKLQVLGTTNNDGTDKIEVSTVAAGTLTLTTASSVTTEAAGASVTLIGRTNPDHQKSLQRVEDIRQLNQDGFDNIVGYPSKYAIFNNDIYFDKRTKEADVFEITYIQVPAEMAADATNSEIPDELIPLVRLWAQYKAWGQVPGEETKENKALEAFEREVRRQITMRNFDDYALRAYPTANTRGRRGLWGRAVNYIANS